MNLLTTVEKMQLPPSGIFLLSPVQPLATASFSSADTAVEFGKPPLFWFCKRVSDTDSGGMVSQSCP